MEYQLQLDQQITVAETNLRSLRHNIANTFGIIKVLIKNNCYEELNDYLDGIYKDIDAANETVSYTHLYVYKRQTWHCGHSAGAASPS